MAKGRDTQLDIHLFESFDDAFEDDLIITEEKASKALSSIAPILSNLKPDFFKYA